MTCCCDEEDEDEDDEDAAETRDASEAGTLIAEPNNAANTQSLVQEVIRFELKQREETAEEMKDWPREPKPIKFAHKHQNKYTSRCHT